MSNELIFVLIVFQLTSATYVMYHHKKHYKLKFEVVILSLLFGPLLALIMKDVSEERTQEESIKNYMNSDRHIRARGFSIPPPPPISQVKKEKKDFKFFRG